MSYSNVVPPHSIGGFSAGKKCLFSCFFALSCKSRVIFGRKTQFDVFLRYAQEVQVNQTLPIGSGILNKWIILKTILFFCFGLALPGNGYIYIFIYIYIIYIIYKYRSFLFFFGESNLDSTIATCVVLMRFPLISEGLFFLTEIYRGNGNHLVMHRWWSFMRSTWHLELIGNRRILERYTVQPK